ncbi:hypothetical protein [Nocardioides immobilis]|uniref:hypothetical protein n=1 Tax=Nocardioides immobilis TaxID=2049295 RepID=UPI001C710E44|nr:hypothetical protein [Nocardioides immobilis]
MLVVAQPGTADVVAGDEPGLVVLPTSPGEPLHDWLTRGRARAALVRPDGTVMAAGRTVADVVQPLASLTVDLPSH